MRKLLLALALCPAASHAALVIDSGKSPPASSAHPIVTAPVSPSGAGPSPTTVIAGRSPAADAPEAEAISVAPIWRIESNDNTFQTLFARWSRVAGWTLIWDVDQDIPLVGRDSFNGSFTDAVLKVSHSTDFTDLPIHPCFYAQTPPLVRIVPISVVCNPENN
ncbi:toxin co-regulated pilus biosynthesis Q family protein [Burkholderia aenigmatica]|uniref:toxin co-regulated pilus biosynthesis Q family protein n=1 Tax=Burkholderia aenigmatica TaxID=2015348 RepID=UPI002654B86B|nr:toxin co-regulated pilus biosynthesis Q family protein [Burkholderia aenigmatica]MDN7880135.1 toxin co-regulated pilus biosynthesis Q family protein [Burkholderia aenigmatica]